MTNQTISKHYLKKKKTKIIKRKKERKCEEIDDFGKQNVNMYALAKTNKQTI